MSPAQRGSARRAMTNTRMLIRSSIAVERSERAPRALVAARAADVRPLTMGERCGRVTDSRWPPMTLLHEASLGRCSRRPPSSSRRG
jgi:hypothetical protein